LHIGDRQVLDFKEKPQSGEGWINGGFFVFDPGVFDFLADDATVLEQSPLETLARKGQLMAYQHSGYWQCMDTIRDRDALQALWDSGGAPWMKKPQ
jgi:glucose-1-phosphate cytidylyltransferase